MDFTFWATFLDSPLGMAIDFSTFVMTQVFVVGAIIRNCSVEGSRRRYVAASITRTVAYPLLVLHPLICVAAFARGSSITAVMLALCTAVLLYDLKTHNDNNWWKGRWTKVKKGLRSLTIKTNTTTAGAAA